MQRLDAFGGLFDGQPYSDTVAEKDQNQRQLVFADDGALRIFHQLFVDQAVVDAGVVYVMLRVDHSVDGFAVCSREKSGQAEHCFGINFYDFRDTLMIKSEGVFYL